MGIGRAAKIATQGAKVLDKTIEVGGKSIKTRELIEQMLKSNRSQADISRALKEANVPFDDTWLKNQITSMKARNPVLKPDKRMRDWEASWTVEKGLNEGKTWDQIAEDLQTAGFKDGLKRAEHARERYYKRLEQSTPANVPPAVIDNGESGPMAPEEQEPVPAPSLWPPYVPALSGEGPRNVQEELARLLSMPEHKKDKKWQEDVDKARKLAYGEFSKNLSEFRTVNEADPVRNAQIDRMLGLIESMKRLSPSGARFMQAQEPTNVDPEATRMPQNLDVPLAPETEN